MNNKVLATIIAVIIAVAAVAVAAPVVSASTVYPNELWVFCHVPNAHITFYEGNTDDTWTTWFDEIGCADYHFRPVSWDDRAYITYTITAPGYHTYTEGVSIRYNQDHVSVWAYPIPY